MWLVGKGDKRNPKQIWPYLYGILFNLFPNFSPNFVFFFLSHTDSLRKCVQHSTKKMSWFWMKVSTKISLMPSKIDERSRAWRGDAHFDVLRPIRDVLWGDHTSVSGHAQSHSDQINIYLASRMSLSFQGSLALFHCAGDGVGGDLSTWCREASNKPARCRLPSQPWSSEEWTSCCMQGTSTLHTDDTTWRPAFDGSIVLCMWHRSVNYAAGANFKRCNCISMMDVAFIIWYYTPYSATTRRPGFEIISVILLQPVAISADTLLCLSFSFSPLRSPQRRPLIAPVHLICATQPGVSRTSPIHV